MKDNTGKILLFYLIIILSFWIWGCGSPAEEIIEIPIVYDSAKYTCTTYEPTSAQYSYNTSIHSTISPVIYVYEYSEEYTSEINFKQVEDVINDKFNPCNLHFTFDDPVYVTLQDSMISYRTHLQSEYRPGKIRMLIFPEGIQLIEQRIGIIQGAADGIPTIENTSTGRPTFFIRSEKLYTDVINHELSHVYGLFHTFHEQDTLNKGLNCDTGDKIPSTITPPEGLSIIVRNCEAIIPQGYSFTDEEIDNFITNPQSYSPDECMDDFELDQCQRMRKIIELNLALQTPIYKLDYADD